MRGHYNISIKRRTFLKTAAGGVVASQAAFAVATTRETLYNGIVLPSIWPPRSRVPSDAPTIPPYLQSRPDVIPIDLGRQLFVDDFLVEETSLTRTFHHPRYHVINPVLKPETEWETRDEYAEQARTPPSPTAMVYSDGVFHDPADGTFKMWYMGGYRRSTCIALSSDGIAWRRPALDVEPGTNVVFPYGRDSATVWLDQFTKQPDARFKMALFHEHNLSLHQSSDGIRWRKIGESGPSGDRTTFFYNPFRRVWVFGIRANQHFNRGRYRQYWEHREFDRAANWIGPQPVAWVKADRSDPPRPELSNAAELYNLDCVAYESVLIGLFTIWRGESPSREKVNDLCVGFSRDGFHWDRPDRRSFVRVSDIQGTWNFSNIQSAGGCCLVVGDELYFYVSGRAGVYGTDLPGTCSTGLAVLRRDGFASLDWDPEGGRVRRLLPWTNGGGALLTRKVTFTGAHLFVNAVLRKGTLTAEVLDETGRVIPGFSREDCIAARGDGTRLPIRWRNATLSRVANARVRFRFWMEQGEFYAFWVSSHASGSSGGYVAAGGPGFRGPVDSPSGF